MHMYRERTDTATRQLSFALWRPPVGGVARRSECGQVWTLESGGAGGARVFERGESYVDRVDCTKINVVRRLPSTSTRINDIAICMRQSTKIVGVPSEQRECFTSTRHRQPRPAQALRLIDPPGPAHARPRDAASSSDGLEEARAHSRQRLVVQHVGTVRG